jgi:hypothetical protein
VVVVVEEEEEEEEEEEKEIPLCRPCSLLRIPLPRPPPPALLPRMKARCLPLATLL